MTEHDLEVDRRNDLVWARERLAKEAGIALVDASRFGKKLLKGFGYPDEVFSRAQDFRAISIVLAALHEAEQRALGAEGRIANALA